MIQAISDQMENAQDEEGTSMLTENEMVLPEFLHTIEQDSRNKDELDHGGHEHHIMPMIQQSNNDSNIEEDNVSEVRSLDFKLF